MGYIYIITNLVTGKQYVGQTTCELKERWKNHCKKTSNCVYLKRAIEKYGYDNFSIQLICICFDDDMDEYEKQYILKFNSVVPNGYNLKIGGNTNSMHNPESKAKISQRLKEYYTVHKHHSPQLGKPHADETKKKISDTLKGRARTSNQLNALKHSTTSRRKAVVQINLDGNIIMSFESVSEAAKCLNMDKRYASGLCHGKTQHSTIRLKFANEYK